MSGISKATDSVSLLDSLQIKKSAPVKQPEPVQEQAPKLEPAPKDNAQIDAKEAKSEKKVDFVENSTPENFKVGFLADPSTGDAGKFKVDSKGLPVLDEKGDLSLDPNGKPVLIKVDDKGSAIPDKDGNMQFVSPADAPKETSKTEEKPSGEVELNVSPVIDEKTNEIKKVKVDEKGLPVFDDKGGLIDDPNGKPVYVKVDKDSNIIPDKDGNPVFVSPNDVPALAMQEKMNGVLKSHAAERVMTGFGYKSTVKSAITIASTKLVEGVSIKTFGAFGKEAVGFGVKHAVAQAVGKELSTMAAKTGATVASKEILKGVAKESAVGAVKALAREGHIAADVANGVLKATLKVEEKVAVHATAKVAEKSIAKATIKVVEQTVAKAGQKGLAEGTAKAVEAGVAKAISRGGKEAAAKLAVEGSEKIIAKTAEKAAIQATAKGTTRAGTRLASLVPVAGAVAGAAITAWDAKDAYDKWKDPNTTKASKYLASATVLIDGASVACEASGVGAPIAWALTGASIVTSGLSDYFRYKKK